ncbi:MAG: choice-of-anchor D domain-containing protein, partial [Acidimicrobiales bacterium]
MSAALADGITNSGDDLRTGWYPNAKISPEVVTGGTFGQLWSTPVNGQVYAQPLVATSSGGSETVIVATETNWVYGIDPDNRGAVRWHQQFPGTPWNPADLGCADIAPSIGTTATPVIDPTTNTVYVTHKVYASGSSGAAAWYLDALDVTTGAERTGFPVKITGAADNVPGVQFDPTKQQQRPGLLLMGGVVYMGFGGHCDSAPWAGWVIGVSTTTAHITARWVDNPTLDGAGIWQAGAGLTSDGPGTLLVTTGNGGSPTTPTPGTSPPSTFGESVIRLNVGAGGKLTPVDFFAPFDAADLDQWDADFGSGALVGLPDQYFGTPSHPHLAVAVGKEGYVYLLDRDNLGGLDQGPNGDDKVVERLGRFGGVWGRPAIWPGDGGYVYVPTSTNQSTFDVYHYVVSGSGASATPTLTRAGSTPDAFGWGTGMPIVTSDAATSGSALVWIVWSADRTGVGAQLRAYSPIPVAGTFGPPVYEAPIGTSANYSAPGVGNDGRLYVGTRDGHLLAFGSPVTQPMTATALGFPTTVVGSTSSRTLTVTANESLKVTGVASSSSQFRVDTSSLGLPAQLAKNGHISIPVTFAPSQPGLAAAQITVTTDSGPVSFPVSGTGQANAPLLAPSTSLVSMGGTSVGNHLSDTVTFSDMGNAPVRITHVTAPAAPFSIVGAPVPGTSAATLAPGTSVSLTVNFDPTQAGKFSDEIQLDTADGEQVKVGIAGTAGTPGHLQFSSESVGFGDVQVGSSATRTFTLTNAGGTDVVINKSKPPFGGSFAALTGLQEGTTLTPGEAITETVSFTPTATGPAAAGSWAITGDDDTGPHIVQFTGTGVPVGGTTTTTTGGTTAPPPVGLRPPVVTKHPVASPRAPTIVPRVATRATLNRTVITYT